VEMARCTVCGSRINGLGTLYGLGKRDRAGGCDVVGFVIGRSAKHLGPGLAI